MICQGRKRKCNPNKKGSTKKPCDSESSFVKVPDNELYANLGNELSDDEPPVKKRREEETKRVIVPERIFKQKGKSNRQTKKEQYVKRKGTALAKPGLKAECLFYLSSWANDRKNWKFNKNKQLWIFHNKFSSNLITNDIWPNFLNYFAASQGKIKQNLISDAKKVIEEMENKTNKQDEDETTYTRARDIIQNMQE